MIDLHMHSTASDGSFTPPELLELLKASGCTTFALTDHDTVDGAAEMLGLVPEGMRYIPGCEFTCTCMDHDFHLLGLGMDVTHEAVVRTIEHGKELRRAKNIKRIRYLKDRCGVALTDEEILSLGDLASAGKPPFARILVARGLAPDINVAIKRYLAPMVDRDRLDSAEAISAVLESGGIPVWAHPIGGENEPRLPDGKFRSVLKDLMVQGIQGIECWYSRYGKDDVDFLLSEAHRHDLLISGGSDFHGSPKPDLPVGRLNSYGRTVTEEDLTVLTRLP